MQHKNTQSGTTLTGRIERQTYNTNKLQSSHENWQSLTKEEKLELTREIEPDSSETIYNVTVTRFHEYLVDNLDPGQTSAKDNLAASWMALGTDSGSGTSTSDTDLNTRVFSEQVTDHADNGTTLLASTFIDSTEANGQTLNEIGLFTGDPANLGDNDVFMINHATFSDVTKDNSSTVTFDVELSFSDT